MIPPVAVRETRAEIGYPFLVASNPAPEPKAAIDWNPIVTIGLFAIGVLGTYYLTRSKSQAQDMDEATLTKANQLVDQHIQRLERVTDKLERSVDKLADKIENLNGRMTAIETRQQGYDTMMPIQLKKVDTLETRVAVIESGINEATRSVSQILLILDSLQLHLANNSDYKIVHKVL